jgi:DNA-binding NarL/FixJ family response regulator
MRVIRVAVADDDDGFREALVDVLNADPRFTVVAAAATGDDLVRLACDTRPDLVVLDVRMPNGGPVALKALRQASEGWGFPVPVVVALTAQSAVSTVLAMLGEGARGFLAKGRVEADLPNLLARSAAGEVVLAVPSAAEALRQLLESVA